MDRSKILQTEFCEKFVDSHGHKATMLKAHHDARSAVAELSAEAPAQQAFQDRVQPWMMECFGSKISADRAERNHRFLEEALELVQACECPREDAHQLVDYVYARDIGEPHQEVGGVQVTLAALCLANNLDMHKAGEDELARIWTKVEKIRVKQAAKPKGSPLPQHVAPAQQTQISDEAVAILQKAILGSGRQAPDAATARVALLAVMEHMAQETAE